jgi:hypothetical protein
MVDRSTLMTGIRWMLLICAVGSFVGYFLFARRMVRGRRDAVAAFDRRLAYNPFNVCFRPSLLTEPGLRARRWFLASLICFPLCVIGLVAIGR